MPHSPVERTVPMLDELEEAELQARMAADPDAREMSQEELGRMPAARLVLPRAVFAALTTLRRTSEAIGRAANQVDRRS